MCMSPAPLLLAACSPLLELLARVQGEDEASGGPFPGPTSLPSARSAATGPCRTPGVDLASSDHSRHSYAPSTAGAGDCV
jgi:hypothetical protein